MRLSPRGLLLWPCWPPPPACSPSALRRGQGIARRLAGARQVRLSELFTMRDLPVGRSALPGAFAARPDPHRSRRPAGGAPSRRAGPAGGRGWRSIERIRESRGFDLWDHGGSLAVDPAQAAEPLVVIPHVWRGSTSELEDQRTCRRSIGWVVGRCRPARSPGRSASSNGFCCWPAWSAMRPGRSGCDLRPAGT